MGDRSDMDRTLGHTGLKVAPVAFGAFKIGRNQKIKYRDGYELPSNAQTAELLNGVIDSGINLIDTAPAYGTSEERLGAWLRTLKQLSNSYQSELKHRFLHAFRQP